MALFWVKSILFLSMSWHILFIFADENIINVLPKLPLNSRNSLDNDEVIQTLTSFNGSISQNFSSESIIDEMENTSDESWTNLISKTNNSKSYQDKFSDQIDYEMTRLLDYIPPFDIWSGNVSSECKRQSEIYRRELKKMNLWALQMYDATAKIPSGILQGNINQLGDFHECIGVEGSDEIQGKYCLASLYFHVDESRPELLTIHEYVQSYYTFKNTETDIGHRIPRYTTILWGVCVPSMCTDNDVKVAIHDLLDKSVQNTGIHFSTNIDKKMCQVSTKKSYSTGTIIACCVFIALITISIIAMICEIHDINVHEMINVFSLKRNYNKLMSTYMSSDEIQIIHGIRALNAVALFFGHKSLSQHFGPFVNRTEMSKRFASRLSSLVRNSAVYTDVFVMISGILTAYSFAKDLKTTGKINIMKEYVSRYIRMTPTLGCFILFYTYIFPYFGSGPFWNYIIQDHSEICQKYGWRNLLYIHNFFGYENMCLTHTHHVGIDTQLYFFSPLLVWILYKLPKYGYIILGILALISTALRFIVAYTYHLNTFIFFGMSIQQMYDTANLTYTFFVHRATVYIMGICLGYILRTCPKDYKLNGIVVKLVSIVTVSMVLAHIAISSNMSLRGYVYSPIDGAMYNAFTPIVWCSMWAWMIFIYHTQNYNKGWLFKIFSWKGLVIFTRISYSFYLVQFFMFFYDVGSIQHAEFYGILKTFDIPDIIFTIIASVLLTVLVDLPSQNIKNYLFQKPKESQSSKTDKTE